MSTPLTTVAVILGAMLPALLALVLITSFASSGSQPKATPSPDTVTVPLNRVISTLTQHDFRGKVRLIIAGTGQVEGTADSDAFYRYTDDQGQPLDPPQPSAFPLKIDGQPATDLAETPLDYQDDHVYTLIYDAGSDSHAISFGLSDSDARDNTGELTIDVVPLD
jgi:hypothetical protein